MNDPAATLDINSIVSGGGFVVFTFFMIFLVTKFFPQLIDSFRTELSNQRESFIQSSKEERAFFERNLNNLNETAKQQSKEIGVALGDFKEIMIRHDTKLNNSG